MGYQKCRLSHVKYASSITQKGADVFFASTWIWEKINPVFMR
jgi:hypothetical protein